MLGLLRRYQRALFLVVTVVIIISFSFFGTYNTLGTNERANPLAFTAVDGSAVYRSDVDDMVLFLGSDAIDKVEYGGVWGPNFLNDGFIRKDLLGTGLASLLVQGQWEQVSEEIQRIAHRERRFELYRHPSAEFISTQNIWTSFAPNLKAEWDEFQRTLDDPSLEHFEHRAKLYVEQSHFPASILRQVLQYQEQQFNWVKPDTRLARADLSLFSHHSLEDWFGKSFLHLSAQLVINGARIAKEKGYALSLEEAKADLISNTQQSFQQLVDLGIVDVADRGEYLAQQLRMMGMDFNRAVQLWQQVLLFRRMMNDVGQAVLLDALSYEQFTAYANEGVSLEWYALPADIANMDFSKMQELEQYFTALGEGYANRADLLAIPTQLRNQKEILKDYPELLEKRFTVEWKRIDKDALRARVGLRELMEWELEDSNWSRLSKEFPHLAQLEASNEEERFAVIEDLEASMKEAIHKYARGQIVEENLDWIDIALSEQEFKKEDWLLRRSGGLILPGLEDQLALVSALESEVIELDSEETSNTSILDRYSQDQRYFYSINLLDRSDWDFISFSAASADGTLKALLSRPLKKIYDQLAEGNAAEIKGEEGKVKTFDEVRESLADRYFKDLNEVIYSDYIANTKEPASGASKAGSFVASYRFFKTLREWRDSYSALDAGGESEQLPGIFRDHLVMNDWSLEISNATLTRSSGNSSLLESVKEQQQGSWSDVNVFASKGLAFYRLVDFSQDEGDFQSLMDQVRQPLMDESIKGVMRDLVDSLNESSSFDISYLSVK